ncbi:Protein of unknown function [Gryllus bimaculatus]|nr:Protein of unknown function [Gryllus bimaculatus]
MDDKTLLARPLQPAYSFLYVRRNLPMRDIANVEYLWMKSVGVIGKQRSIGMEYSRAAWEGPFGYTGLFFREEPGPRVLQLSDLWGYFLLLALGLCLAVAAFVVERLLLATARRRGRRLPVVEEQQLPARRTRPSPQQASPEARPWALVALSAESLQQPPHPFLALGDESNKSDIIKIGPRRS